MTHQQHGYPVDYTAQNAREFSALRGVELIDAKVNQRGELVVTFDVSVSDPATAEQRMRAFAGALLPMEEEPESVRFEELGRGIVPMPDSKIVPIPDFTKD